MMNRNKDDKATMLAKTAYERYLSEWASSKGYSILEILNTFYSYIQLMSMTEFLVDTPLETLSKDFDSVMDDFNRSGGMKALGKKETWLSFTEFVEKNKGNAFTNYLSDEEFMEYLQCIIPKTGEVWKDKNNKEYVIAYVDKDIVMAIPCGKNMRDMTRFSRDFFMSTCQRTGRSDDTCFHF